MPDTLRGFGLITGARRDGPPFKALAARSLLNRDDSGDVGAIEPFVRESGIPRCCWRFDTSDTLEAFWLSYGDCGLIARWPKPVFIRLSTLLRLESSADGVSRLPRNPAG